MKPFLDRFFSTERDAIAASTSASTVGQHRQPPAYVTTLVVHPDGAPDFWAQEFQRDLEDFNALLVFDYREADGT